MPPDPVLRRAPLLLVEDNPGDAGLISDFLEGEPLRHVGSLGAAAASLAAESFSVILLDLHLPDGTGVGTVQRLRKVSKVPIVVLTGTDDESLALDCIAVGADDYLSKNTLAPEGLRRAIRYAIARHGEAVQRSRADALQIRLAALVESSSDGVVSLDSEGRITTFNAAAERLFGLSRSATDGHTFESLLGFVVQPDGQVVEVAYRRADGTELVMDTVASSIVGPSGESWGTSVVLRDMTEHRRRDAELSARNAELLERNQQMRALAAKLQNAREVEGTRISREVHDTLGALLTGLKMDLHWIRKSLPEGPGAERLLEASRLVDELVVAVQRIAIELRPSALDALGLASALRDEGRRIAQRTGFASKATSGRHHRAIERSPLRSSASIKRFSPTWFGTLTQLA